jgi:hypothetical protein
LVETRDEGVLRPNPGSVTSTAAAMELRIEEAARHWIDEKSGRSLCAY